MNWIDFLQDHNIEYKLSGQNVKKGNVNVRCPFCGDDPSHHMGISLTQDAWGCWRHCGKHGRSPIGLIIGLLGCSVNQAKLNAATYNNVDPDSLLLITDEFDDLHKKTKQVTSSSLELLPEFKNVKTEDRFWNYFLRRGFDDIDNLLYNYNLKCCNTGIWQDRIIIPVYQNYKLVSWVGRSLQKPILAPRYKVLSENEGALTNIKNVIFNEDYVRDQSDGKVLFIVEGPFDALKVDFYAGAGNSNAVCTFGTTVTPAQISILIELIKKYESTVLLFDEGALESVFDLMSILDSYSVKIGELPNMVDDPGELTKNQVKELVKKYSE